MHLISQGVIPKWNANETFTMRYAGNAKWTVPPQLGVSLRYGLAVTSVAAALATTLILRHYNSPPRFISHFTMIAIAITFWYAGTGPGLLALTDRHERCAKTGRVISVASA
jgi:hypothetical protein